MVSPFYCFIETLSDVNCRLAEGQTQLRKKGQGRPIHVSDFITPKTGHLILLDDDNNIIEDA